MWKHHAIYESRPRSVIITLGGHLYRIPEVVPTTAPPKQCCKVVSHTRKFIFSTICPKGEQKDTAATTASAKAPSIQIQVDIGGHPPFPVGSKQFSDNFGNLLFLVVFWVLNFQSRFEDPK